MSSRPGFPKQAARRNAVDMIPAVFRIVSWQLWGQAHQRAPGPVISWGTVAAILGQGCVYKGGWWMSEWFLKGSRILLLRQRLWKTTQTPQRGLRKPQSPERTHQVREAAGLSKGMQVGAGGCRIGSGDSSGRLGSCGGVVSPGLISWSLFVLYLPMAVILLPSILDQDSPPSPDDITKEKHTPAPEPESSYEASEPPAKRSKR